MARKQTRPVEEALRAAIIEAPEDDAPRLVYADWLTEHGSTEADLARAEFIREQIRLEREGGASTVYSAGSRRLDDLRRTHAGAWEQGLPKWASGKARYRRGFIEGVSATARQFLKDGAGLRALLPLQRLRLERPVGLLGAVADSGLLTGLRTFGLDDPRLTPEDLRALAACHDLEGLTRLHMGRCRLGPAGMRILARAEWLAGVEELYLLGNEFGREGAEVLAAVPFRMLKDLNLQADYVGDDGLATLLKSLHLPIRLTTFNLSYNRLSPEGIRALADCAALGSLCALGLMNNDVGDEGARALAASPHLARLTMLNLREARVADAGAAALAASPYLSRLVELELYDNPILGEGIFALLGSQHLKELARLSVYSPRRRQDEAALQAVRDRFDRR
jgi:uncharacterized protein (TIGR02996 family)